MLWYLVHVLRAFMPVSLIAGLLLSLGTTVYGRKGLRPVVISLITALMNLSLDVGELPGRLRISLSIPGRYCLDGLWMGKHLKSVEGVREVSFTKRTRNLLVVHRGSLPTRSSTTQKGR